MHCMKRWALLAAAVLVAGMFVDAAEAGRCGRRGGCGRRSSCGWSRGCSTGGCYTGNNCSTGSCNTGSCNTGNNCYTGDCSTGSCPAPQDEAAPATSSYKVKVKRPTQSAARVTPSRTVAPTGVRG